MKVSTIILSIICCMLVSCNRNNAKTDISFYFWRTTFELSEIEQQALANNNVKRVYVRYFDVDVDKQGVPFPVSPIKFKEPLSDIEIIPVIYIKNRVMLQDSLKINVLANNICDYVEQINKKSNLPAYNEIQIDCDWTLKSRDKFMQFIDTLKAKSHKKLSATIRLHQVKHYTKTKVPNVDYGTLMYYNVGKIAADTLNSIYDREITKNYIKSLKNYPIKLNVALPIYAWGVHIRDNKVINLANKTDKSIFENDTNFLIPKNSNIIEVVNSTIKDGRYYLRNDKIKIEQISEKDLLEMIKDIRKQLPYTANEVIFFDLDEINIRRYNYETDFFKKMATNF